MGNDPVLTNNYFGNAENGKQRSSASQNCAILRGAARFFIAPRQRLPFFVKKKKLPSGIAQLEQFLCTGPLLVIEC
jgi:hypothetical protein